MNDLHIPHGSAYDGADRLGGRLFWLIFGAITAVVALVVNGTIDGFLIGVVQITSDVEACNEGFSDGILYGILAMTILTSFVVVTALWRMRSHIGEKAEGTDLRWALHLRRSFTISAIGIFVLASPLKWALILGMANC